LKGPKRYRTPKNHSTSGGLAIRRGMLEKGKKKERRPRKRLQNEGLGKMAWIFSAQNLVNMLEIGRREKRSRKPSEKRRGKVKKKKRERGGMLA